jgi:8-oxo-dGTP pyrophosphatase MutT (NUDIX family)
MEIRIYFNAKTLYLTDEITPELDDYLHRKETIFIDELDGHTVATMIHEMEQDTIYQGVFLHHDVTALLEAFKKKLTLVQAGGGFVYHEKDVLLIHRRGKWDLPKGKLDDGETIEDCAVREVQEETGIQNVAIEKPLLTTYHTYHQGGDHILKESHWFLMKAAGKEQLKAQTEEDITECCWVPMDKLEGYVINTHGSIRDVVKVALPMFKSGN